MSNASISAKENYCRCRSRGRSRRRPVSRGISRRSASHGRNRNHASSLTFIFQSKEPAKYSTDIVTRPSPVEVGSFKEQSNTEKEEGNIGYRGGSCYPSNCLKLSEFIQHLKEWMDQLMHIYMSKLNKR